MPFASYSLVVQSFTLLSLGDLEITRMGVSIEDIRLAMLLSTLPMNSTGADREINIGWEAGSGQSFFEVKGS
jgi:hypothetical protein